MCMYIRPKREERERVSESKSKMIQVIGGITFVLVLLVGMSDGLDKNEMGRIDGMNCTYYRMHSKSNDSAPTMPCQPWTLASGRNSCTRGPGFLQVVKFAHGTGQTLLSPFYCMTTSDNLTERRDVVGGCFYSAGIPHEIQYFPLPCNISQLNQYMCADLNREGQLCGKCKEGYAPPVYSYSLSCVNCTDYSYKNWLKYIAIAYGPLTVFCTIIIVLHISATSPYLHGYILFCQLIALPTIIRLLVIDHAYKAYRNQRLFTNMYASLVGIWNLDFFRLVYKPFCLHPDMTIIQSLSLDYLVALYPLTLVAVTLSLVSLYYKNCKVVVFLWKPVRWCVRPVFRDLDIRASLVESFSTLYLLSVVKIQSVSLDLLLPTPLYYADGTQSKTYYLYLAGDQPYFGDHHTFFALLALVLYLTLVLFPTLLLILYPCQCFQRCLNRINYNSQILRTYMDVFQGHYKDGTGNNSRDFRFFSGVFLVARAVGIVLFSLLNSNFAYTALGLFLTILALTVAIVRPQKTYTHYLLDCIFLSLLSTIVYTKIGSITGTRNRASREMERYLAVFAISLPQLYFMCLILYWIIKVKRIPQRISTTISRNLRCCLVNTPNDGENSSLLNPHH